MHVSLFSIISLALSATAAPQSSNPAPHPLPVGQWQAPGPNDLRAACPFMNTLSNHGFLPRDGGPSTLEDIKKAFNDGIDTGSDVADLFFNGARNFKMTRMTNGVETLSVGDISGHDLIEHDASMVRDDIYFHNDPITKNQTLLRTLLTSFSSDGKTISLYDLAKFRKFRHDDSKARNPNFTFGIQQEFLCYGEASLFLSVFGSGFDYKIPLSQVDTFLGQDRFPDDFKPQRHTSLLSVLAILPRLKIAAGIFSS
jgi:hypothetical protein